MRVNHAKLFYFGVMTSLFLASAALGEERSVGRLGILAWVFAMAVHLSFACFSGQTFQMDGGFYEKGKQDVLRLVYGLGGFFAALWVLVDLAGGLG